MPIPLLDPVYYEHLRRQVTSIKAQIKDWEDKAQEHDNLAADCRKKAQECQYLLALYVGDSAINESILTYEKVHKVKEPIANAAIK